MVCIIPAPHFHTLWISYICLVNALCLRQSGRCPLLHETVFFAALFPLSAVFWWFFEYLNQFAQNWFYTGVDYGPAAYSIHATISFSTVLPAVYTSRMWLLNIRWFKKRFHGLPSLQRSMPKFLNWLILLLSCTGLVGIALRPGGVFCSCLAGSIAASDRLTTYSRTKNALYQPDRRRLATCGLCRHGRITMRFFLGNVELLQPGQMGIQYSLRVPVQNI